MSTPRPYTPTQVLFLSRLQRLVAGHQHMDAVNTWRQGLLRRATLSTYLDCLALGLDVECGLVLGQLSSAQAGRGEPGPGRLLAADPSAARERP